jgi:uncharacterized membrane protein
LTIALEVLFAMLVAADTILTYIVIGSGKGTEIGPVAKYYIDNKPVAIIITVVATAFLIGWLRLVGMAWMLIPCILRLAWLCRKHWRILHGR